MSSVLKPLLMLYVPVQCYTLYFCYMLQFSIMTCNLAVCTCSVL
uniref:Uncharacterized protein n=1 Tax=Anguilla anguilla TaxID=7936 RepID=A0A0E9VE68_ANGAN